MEKAEWTDTTCRFYLASGQTEKTRACLQYEVHSLLLSKKRHTKAVLLRNRIGSGRLGNSEVTHEATGDHIYIKQRRN